MLYSDQKEDIFLPPIVFGLKIISAEPGLNNTESFFTEKANR